MHVGHNRISRRYSIDVAGSHVAGRQDRVTRRNSLDHVVRRHLIFAEPVRINPDHDRSLVPAEWRRRRDSRQRREHRPDAKQGEVLNLTDVSSFAREYQLAYRNASRIVAHDERRDGSGRHEGPSPLNIRDGLRERLAHVGSGVKLKLHQSDVLNRPGFNVLDSGDVEEVVFVV